MSGAHAPWRDPSGSGLVPCPWHPIRTATLGLRSLLCYGMHCSEAELTIAVWDMPVKDVSGQEAKIPFYLTLGNGFLLLGNEILHQSRLLGPADLLVIPAGVRGISRTELSLQTYSEPVSLDDKDSRITYLFIVPSKTSTFKSYFATYRTLFSNNDRSALKRAKFSDGRVARGFAVQLHGFSHLSLQDVLTLCKRGGVLTPILRQALDTVVTKCTSCKSTGRPLISRKISSSKILASFNTHVQIDFMFIVELCNKPILHLINVHTGFSVTALLDSREMELATQEFKAQWCNVHGALSLFRLTKSSTIGIAKSSPLTSVPDLKLVRPVGIISSGLLNGKCSHSPCCRTIHQRC